MIIANSVRQLFRALRGDGSRRGVSTEFHTNKVESLRSRFYWARARVSSDLLSASNVCDFH